MSKKRVLVIGAGPGGLVAAAILSPRGSGMPSIFESGRIFSILICEVRRVAYEKIDLASELR